jgi:hypothetical protein
MVRDGGWLFPGRNPINPIGPRMLDGAVHEAARTAGIVMPLDGSLGGGLE